MMISRIYQKRTMWLAAFILLTPLASAEISKTSKVPAVLTDLQFISDLESRACSLAADLAGPPVLPSSASRVLLDSAAYSAKVKAVAGIRRVLEFRKFLTENSVIPKDPYHRANRDHQLAVSDIQIAIAWWSYCEGMPNYVSLNLWNSLKLWFVLGSRLQESTNALVVLNPKPDTAKTVGIVPLPPAIATRLKNSKTGGNRVLDRVAGWDRLSDDQKSKIIIR